MDFHDLIFDILLCFVIVTSELTKVVLGSHNPACFRCLPTFFHLVVMTGLFGFGDHEKNAEEITESFD